MSQDEPLNESNDDAQQDAPEESVERPEPATPYEGAADEQSDEDAPEPPPVEAQEPAEPTAAESGPRLVLKRAGQETEHVFACEPPAVIGRFDPGIGPIDVDLGEIEEASYVSRKHARLTMEEDGYVLEDLGSSNGTFVLRDDYERIEEPTVIEPDTEIAFGNARFVFKA